MSPRIDRQVQSPESTGCQARASVARRHAARRVRNAPSRHRPGAGGPRAVDPGRGSRDRRRREASPLPWRERRWRGTKATSSEPGAAVVRSCRAVPPTIAPSPTSSRASSTTSTSAAASRATRTTHSRTCRSAARTPGGPRCPSRRTCIRAAGSPRRTPWSRVGREAADQALTTTRAQLLFDVTQAYYDAALSERLVAIAEATLEQADATLRQTQAGFDAGTQPEFEVLRARVTRDNQTPLRHPPARQPRRRAAAPEAAARPAGRTPTCSSPTRSATSAWRPPPPFAERGGGDRERRCRRATRRRSRCSRPRRLPERNAVAEAETAVQAARSAAAVAVQAERMPSVSLTSNYSRIAYPDECSCRRSTGRNWSVGASVNVPILTGGRQRGDEMVARAELEQARLQLRQMRGAGGARHAVGVGRAAWRRARRGRRRRARCSRRTRAYEIADVRYQRRRVDAARAVRLAAAAAAGRGESRAGRARSAGGARAGGAAARTCRSATASAARRPQRRGTDAGAAAGAGARSSSSDSFRTRRRNRRSTQTGAR